jgi:transposase-like protein
MRGRRISVASSRLSIAGEVARLVIDSGRTILGVAGELGLGAQLLGKWVKVEKVTMAPTPLNMDEREELKLLRKENADLRMDNEFWGKEKQRPCCAREASVDERYALMHVQKAHVSMARMARQMISLPFLDTISGSMPTIATMRVVRHVSRLVAVWML